MATGGVITNVGKMTMLQRTYDDSITKVSQFKVGKGTTTPAVTDTNIETELGTPFIADFVAGYPTYDSTNNRATVRGYITSTQCNGETITECGEFNTDGTKKMLSHDVFTGISKSSTDEIAIVWVHEVHDY